jgi:hypothetical protein
MKRTVRIFTSAMIAAGVVVASAYAQSSIVTNRNGNYLAAPPCGQVPSLPPLTNRPSLTGKRPLPPRLNSVSLVAVKSLPSVNPVPPQQTVRLQQPVPQPQSVASIKPPAPGTPPAQQK